MKTVTRKILWWLFIVFNFLAIIFLWWDGSSHLLNSGSGWLIALGRITGLFAEFSLALMLLLISRFQPLESVFGHDQLNKWHRYLGYSLSVFLLSHPAFLIVGYSQRDDKTWFNQLGFFLREWEDVFPAIIALILFVVVILISIPKIKKLLKYENWHGVHLLTYLAFILAIGHQFESGDFTNTIVIGYWYVLNFGCFAILFLFKWVRPLWMFNKHRFYIDRVVSETNNIFSLYIKGKDVESFKFKAGQYANLIILNKELFWPHPFSFSHEFNGEWLRFTIKELGDYTTKIKLIKPGTKVVIDGPLGKFTTDDVKNNKFLLIAGGVGVTPIMALAQSLAKNNKDLVILNGVKNETELVFDWYLKKATDKYYVFLSEKDVSYENENSYGGYIDIGRLEKVVTDYKEREIYICGPEQMMVSVVNILKANGVNRKQIHFEKFNY